MSEKKRTEIKSKMTDYKRFSIVLLFVSACFSMGAVVPLQGRTVFDEVMLGVAGIGLLIVAGFFYFQSDRLKQLVENHSN